MQKPPTSPDDLIEVTISAESGFTDIVAGHLLNAGAALRAFATTADVIVIHGYINRYEYSRP